MITALFLLPLLILAIVFPIPVKPIFLTTLYLRTGYNKYKKGIFKFFVELRINIKLITNNRK